MVNAKAAAAIWRHIFARRRGRLALAVRKDGRHAAVHLRRRAMTQWHAIRHRLLHADIDRYDGARALRAPAFAPLCEIRVVLRAAAVVSVEILQEAARAGGAVNAPRRASTASHGFFLSRWLPVVPRSPSCPPGRSSRPLETRAATHDARIAHGLCASNVPPPRDMQAIPPDFVRNGSCR